MVCVGVAVMMGAPWDSSSWIPDQNPHLSGRWRYSIFPSGTPTASSPLLLGWGWNHSGHCEGGL